MTDRWSPPILDVAGGASRILFLMLALAGGLMAGVALIFSFNSEMRGPGLVIAGIPGALLLGVAAWVAHRARTRRLTIHDEGVCARDGGRTLSLRYDQIDAIELKAWQVKGVHVAGAGAIGAIASAAVNRAGRTGATDLPYDATQLTVTLRGADKRVVLRKWDKRWLEAYGAIRARVEPRLLGLARAELSRSGATAFGPIKIAAGEIAIGDKKTVPFGELETIEIDFARVAFKRRGKRLPAATVRLGKVPNLHVMLDLVATLRPRIA